jgi:hypothetical protein
VAHRLALPRARLSPHLLGRGHVARPAARPGGDGGLPAQLYTEFPDLELRDLVGAEGIAEFPVAVVTLGDAAPGWTPTARGEQGSVDASPLLQLAAGLVEGRLHLAAYALGYGASGMTFLDTEIPGLLQDDLQAMIFTCVGVPEYANRPGGRPGEPVPVRRVQPRLDD